MIEQPIIRMEIEGMKHTVVAMLRDHALMLDTELNKAVKDYCRPENVEDIIARQVQTSVDEAIQDEIRDFYRYGKGRSVIKAAVELTLGGE